MDPKQEKAHTEAMRHMENATGRLKESIAVHEAEQRGLIGRDEAIETAVALNEEASREVEQAIDAINEFDRCSTMPKDERF